MQYATDDGFSAVRVGATAVIMVEYTAAMNINKINPATLKITDMRFADIDGAPKQTIPPPPVCRSAEAASLAPGRHHSV